MTEDFTMDRVIKAWVYKLGSVRLIRICLIVQRINGDGCLQRNILRKKDMIVFYCLST